MKSRRAGVQLPIVDLFQFVLHRDHVPPQSGGNPVDQPRVIGLSCIEDLIPVVADRGYLNQNAIVPLYETHQKTRKISFRDCRCYFSSAFSPSIFVFDKVEAAFSSLVTISNSNEHSQLSF